MSLIDPTNQLVALMRTQLHSAHPTPNALSSLTGKTNKADKKTTAAKVSAPLARDRHLIAQVAAISPNDPQRNEKAFRLFMASIFAKEFGVELVGNMELEQLLDQVLQEMQADTHLHTAMQDAAKNLLAGIWPSF